MQDYIQEMVNERVWAVIGVSQNTTKFGYKIFKDLLEAGYTVYPVHPAAEFVDGHRCYKTVHELPHKPGVVNLVVPPAVGEKVIEDCIAANIGAVWFQPGAESKAAINKAQEAGLKVVYNACALVERKDWH